MKRLPEARPGFTLTEVLMAMFVMAIGMISLLALFPAGFLNARWALDTEQVSRGAANAQAQTEIPRVSVFPQLPGELPRITNTAQSIRNDDFYRPETTNGSLCWQQCVANPVIAPNALIRFNATLLRDSFLKSATTGTWTFNANINALKPAVIPNAKVKYPPVYVDPQIAMNSSFIEVNTQLPFHVGVTDIARTPFGYNVPALTPRLNGATDPTKRPPYSVGIPRFSTSQYRTEINVGVPTPAVTLRMLGEISNGDEVDFGRNGQPNTVNNTTGIPSGQFSSQRRFSWAYMCHWYDYATPDVCDAFAVVYNTRPTNGGLATLPPGETTYAGFPTVATDAGIEIGTGPSANDYGRAFVKGLSQAAFRLPTLEPSSIRTGDWILDSTMVLPEYDSVADQTYPTAGLKVPFLDEFHPAAMYTFNPAPGVTINLRPGLVGGHFYKVLDISPVRDVSRTGAGPFYQTITLDRPAKSDGFNVTHLAGVADVIVKGVGRMPQR